MSKFLSKNLAAKIISILFALLLWIYVMSVINPRITREELNIPVKLVNENIIRQSGLVVYGNPEPTIRVRLTGNRDQVHRVTRNNIDAKVDLRGYEEGTNSIPIEVSVPGGVEVEYSPRYVTVELERIVEKQIPVGLNVEGTPASGFVVGETQIKPEEVWVEGPESYINSIEEIVAQLQLSNENNNISKSLPLRAINSRGEEVDQVEVKTGFVEVNVMIDQIKSVPVEIDMNIQGAEGYRIVRVNSEPRSVTVRGQSNVLEGISRLKTELVELRDLTESKQVRVPILFPDQVRPHNEREILLDIEVKAMQEHILEIGRENIRYENKDADLTLDEGSLPEKVHVRLTALGNSLENLDTRTIMIFIDLEGLEAGVHEVFPRVWLPMNVENIATDVVIEPESFEIQLLDPETE
ncbi:CdaR family protein [Tindallia californiensis]|uniref:YbbR domain-containing protein n=1 Tax=Tindallia californiensis TaxID=159292 RepID=A0A1H3KKS1_9FIRM|nr:CdaR family protein [Tindallia californiensis]SDY52620.1 YbbR domain-containing protein [Tindallia californiensis]